MAFIKMSFADLSTPVQFRALLSKTALKAVFGAAVVAGVLGAGQAQALIVTVNGQTWDIKYFDGTQNGPNAALFQTSANGGKMPWYTNDAASCGNIRTPTVNSCLATQFANALGTQLNAGSPSATVLFAFSPVTSGATVGQGEAGPPVGPEAPATRTGQYICTNPGTCGAAVASPFLGLDTDPVASTQRWAYADLVLVPGPLPLFGAAAAFGFSRKLRKRINVSKAVGASFPAA